MVKSRHAFVTLKWLLITILLAVTASVVAQSSGGEFLLTKSSIDGGGGSSSGPTFELRGTIAQPDSNPQMSTGGEFVLAGGFWAKASESIFLDGFEGGF